MDFTEVAFAVSYESFLCEVESLLLLLAGLAELLGLFWRENLTKIGLFCGRNVAIEEDELM